MKPIHSRARVRELSIETLPGRPAEYSDDEIAGFVLVAAALNRERLVICVPPKERDET